MEAVYIYNGLSRQAHWENVKRLTLISEKEPCYIGMILELREMHPGMGLRKMYEQFEPEGIGRDAFISLGLREGFRLKTMDNPQRTTISIKSNRYKNLLVEKRFTDINQLWVSDLFYFSVEGEHNYVVLIMDVYSRRILGYSISDNMRAENNINALQMALTIRGVKDYKGSLIHHSDRGSQYISNIYTDLLENYGVQISMCSDVLENAHCERVNGTIKNEYLKRWEIKTYKELQKKVKKAINNYNDRLHYSIKKTPNEYEVYLNSIPLEKREILEIFTIKKTVEDSLQIEINF
jgi:putative transposase